MLQRRRFLPVLRIEVLFIVFLMVFGTVSSFITPPFQAPDEPVHFYRAYAISEFDFFSSHHPIPVNILRVLRDPYDHLPAQSNEHIHPADLLPVFNTPLDPGNDKMAFFISATFYPPVIYFPQAFGIGMARLFNLNTGWLLYLGRLFNLLFFGVLGILALRLTPSHRWLFFCIMMLPMLVFLASMLSPDAFTTGMALVMAALVLRMASNCVEHIGWREAGWLALVFALVSASKVPYCLLTLVYFLIPVGKFGSRKSYWIKTISLFLLVAAVVVVTQLPALIQDGAIRHPGTNEQQIADKLALLVHQPFAWIKLFARTQIQELHTYVNHYLGVFGWLDAAMPSIVYYLFIPVFLIAMMDRIPGLKLNMLQRGLMLGVSALVYLMIHVLIYLSYSAINAPEIGGVQGRYFLPMGPLPFLPFNSEWLADKLKKVTPWVVPSYAFFALAVMVRTLLRRYYFGY